MDGPWGNWPRRSIPVILLPPPPFRQIAEASPATALVMDGISDCARSRSHTPTRSDVSHGYRGLYLLPLSRLYLSL